LAQPAVNHQPIADITADHIFFVVGWYALDMEKQPPELLYDLWTHESQILMAQK